MGLWQDSIAFTAAGVQGADRRGGCGVDALTRARAEGAVSRLAGGVAVAVHGVWARSQAAIHPHPGSWGRGCRNCASQRTGDKLRFQKAQESFATMLQEQARYGALAIVSIPSKSRAAFGGWAVSRSSPIAMPRRSGVFGIAADASCAPHGVTSAEMATCNALHAQGADLTPRRRRSSTSLST